MLREMSMFEIDGAENSYASLTKLCAWRWRTHNEKSKPLAFTLTLLSFPPVNSSLATGPSGLGVNIYLHRVSHPIKYVMRLKAETIKEKKDSWHQSFVFNSYTRMKCNEFSTDDYFWHRMLWIQDVKWWHGLQNGERENSEDKEERERLDEMRGSVQSFGSISSTTTVSLL